MRDSRTILLFAPFLITGALGCGSGDPATTPEKPTGSGAPGADIGGKLDAPWGEDGIADPSRDPRCVLVDRIALAEATDHQVRVIQQPFSHRARRAHAYPFQAYGNSTIRISLDVGDPAMADSSAVWVYGPMADDGTWPKPQRAKSEAGQAIVEVSPTAASQYVAVVAPIESSKFLERYPGSGAWLLDENNESFDVRFVYDLETNEASFESPDGARWVIQSPTPIDAPQSRDISVKAGNGRTKSFYVEAWTHTSWYVSEFPDETGNYLYIGDANVDDPGVYSFAASTTPGRFEDYTLLDAVGPGGEKDSLVPAFIRVVPAVFSDGGRSIVIEDEGIDGPILVPMREDGGDVAMDEVAHFKPMHIDLEESSTYDLSFACDGMCSPASASTNRTLSRTRYPIYFAHGVKASKDSWKAILEYLQKEGPGWQDWITAESVPGLGTLPDRAEQLRINLSEYIEKFEPAPGEKFVRVNIVAHSMGGLDSRFLLGTPKYNEDCTLDLCPPDEDGNPVMWKHRVASLTTLSSPHLGSSFADRIIGSMDSGLLSVLLRPHSRSRRFIDKYFGWEGDESDELRAGLVPLSQKYSQEEFNPQYPPVNPDRVYDWACATGKSQCNIDAAASDLPIQGGVADTHRLPVPDEITTVFSWSGISCVSGSCGAALDPELLWPYTILYLNEGKNDGVVSTDSSEFGIFMGVRTRDHYHWTRSTHGQVASFVTRVFGVETEPAEHFISYWLTELEAAGY